jgi:hypothetical protein
MAVVEDLSESERYLYAILEDRSGIDLAEFTWYEADAPDGCFRAWPFQIAWWRNQRPLQVDQCSRSVGKSLSIKVRAFAFPFCFPGQEMVITAPELVHLEPIIGLIENQLYATRLSREMIPRTKSAVTHRPFMANFASGSRIIGRIPQRDGKGVKGIHPIRLELDEAQDYPSPGWTELVETLKRGEKDAQWRAHGVTRGVHDKFFEFTQDTPDNEWFVHRYPAMFRPNWTDQERQEKIKQYGSREDPDYRRNVLGAHGDATNPIFVLHRFMRSVVQDESDPYNLEEYHHVNLKDTDLEALGIEIEEALDLPAKSNRYDVYWCGMDVGFTTDPSEVLVWAEYHLSEAGARAEKAAGRVVPLDGLSRLKLIARYSLRRISQPLQVRALIAIIDHYKPRAFSMDKTGNGLPLFQELQHRIETAAAVTGGFRQLVGVIKGYNFSEKVIVDIDQSVEQLSGKIDDVVRDAGINRNVLEFSTDKLREYVDQGRLLLPWDRELIGEFSGQTYSYSKATMDMYGRRRRIFSQGTFHALDAARMAIMGHAQAPIEAMIAAPQDTGPVLDGFIMM